MRIAASVFVGLVLLLVYVDAIPVLGPVSHPFDLFFQNNRIRVYIHATISSSEPAFADQVPVTVHAVGSIGFEQASDEKQVYDVCLCLSGAYWLLDNQIMTSPATEQLYAGIHLGITHTLPKEHLEMQFGPGAYLTGYDTAIEWLSPIESVPYIIVTYLRFALINGIEQQDFDSHSFPAQTIHVESRDTLEANKTTLKLYVAEMILGVLGIVQFSLWAITKREKTKPRRRRKSPTRQFESDKDHYSGNQIGRNQKPKRASQARHKAEPKRERNT